MNRLKVLWLLAVITLALGIFFPHALIELTNVPAEIVTGARISWAWISGGVL